MKNSGMNFPAIYTITCIPNGKIYVGQAVNVRRRWHSHKWYLRKGDHRNGHLQRAWNKYGESSFVFAVAKTFPGLTGEELFAALNTSEIEVLSSIPHAFNLTEAAQSRNKLSDETKAKLSKIRKELWQNPEFRDRRQKNHLEAINTPEWKARHAEIARERSQDTAFREKMKEVNKQNWANGDPERAKKRGELERKNWSDPEYRAKQSKSRSLAWSDPEVRAKRIAGIKAAHARRKAENSSS